MQMVRDEEIKMNIVLKIIGKGRMKQIKVLQHNSINSLNNSSDNMELYLRRVFS